MKLLTAFLLNLQVISIFANRENKGSSDTEYLNEKWNTYKEGENCKGKLPIKHIVFFGLIFKWVTNAGIGE